MATKREIMAVGTAAPLARMLGSDSPHVVQPGGTDQATATRLETNFVVLTGAAAGGVRLPRAGEQYLHFLFNSTVYTVGVYPHDDERINNQLPGEPFLLEAWMSGAFVPSRRAWIGGALPGSAAVVPSSIPGPFGVGVEPPADAQTGSLFASNALTLDARVSIVGAPNTTHLLANAYANESATEFVYLADGPAADIVFNSQTQLVNVRLAAPGNAGAPIAWYPVARFSFIPAESGAVSAVTDLGLNWEYGPGSDSSYIANGAAAALSLDIAAGPAGAMTLWMAPPGAAGGVIPAGSWDDCVAFQHSSQLANSQTTLTLLFRDNTGAVRFTPVTVGAPNSGGAGFRQLVVPN